MGEDVLRERMEILKKGTYDKEKESVTFNQEDVMKTGDFVNMSTTPFAWARAFPTVFIPTYVDGEWKIFHDITGCFDMDGIRDKSVKLKDWLEFLMYCSDGVPAAHPTFSLVAWNHKLKQQLQGQGHYTLNTSGLDPNMLGDQFLKMWEDPKAGPTELMSRLHQTSSNVQGTNAYWVAKRFEFKAISFNKSFIHNQQPSLFHTGSVAEFHEPHLRILLYQYIKMLNNPLITEEMIQGCLSDDKIFLKMVQKYKNIVTTYVAVKMEIWMSTFMAPVHGVEGGNLSFEFASSRGAIHYHSILFTNYNVKCEGIDGEASVKEISTTLKNLETSYQMVYPAYYGK